MGHPIYTGEEIVARGKTLYEQQIRPRVEEGNEGKYLVIDTVSGGYELEKSIPTAHSTSCESGIGP
jgi:hypothetical protein